MTDENAPADPGAPQDAAEFAAKQLEAAIREREDWKDKAMRARADYDNLQKRTVRDAQLERERSKARALEGFLPLAELAGLAATQAAAEPGPLADGVMMLQREFERFLGTQGLTVIGAIGETPDASRHAVLATEAAEGVASGKVSRVVAPGYLLDGKVLRYAKVCVAP